MTTWRVLRRETTPSRLGTLALAIALALTIAPGLPARAAADPSLEAQQFIYEMNLARWNPASFEARADDASLPVDVPDGYIATPPVAVNGDLGESAMFKSNELADFDYWSHQSAVTGKWPNQLARDFGYDLPHWWISEANYIESLAAGPGSPFAALVSLARSAGHSVHIFGQSGFAQYDEIGVGRSSNEFYWAIHTAYREPDRRFVTGVVYEDDNHNGRMDLGEGLAGATVRVGGTTVAANAGGGYSVEVAPGTYATSSPGAGNAVVYVDQHNVGVDFALGRAPIVRAYQLCNGLEPTMLGTSGDDTLHATPHRDVIHGLEGSDVVLGAGPEDVICSAVDGTANPGATERIAGPDRFATAAAISQSTHPGGSQVVYVAVGTNYPDAVAAGAAAATEGAPILLVRTDTVPVVTQLELERLDPSRIIVLGGRDAIGSAVEADLRALIPSASVIRRDGPTRYETAAQVSRGAFGTAVDTVFVTGGEDFATAIAAAPAAIAAGSPLLLVPHDHVPAAVETELDRLDPSHIVVVGGRNTVSQAVLAELTEFADSVTRIAASDGYDAAVEVSEQTFDPGLATVYVAVGDRFPDALAGGPATRLSPGPILLVTRGDVPDAVRDELDRLRPGKIVILGGPAAVSDAVESLLAQYVAD